MKRTRNWQQRRKTRNGGIYEGQSE